MYNSSRAPSSAAALTPIQLFYTFISPGRPADPQPAETQTAQVKPTAAAQSLDSTFGITFIFCALRLLGSD